MTLAKRWFVTGVSSGIGRCIAELALARGEEVVATFRQQIQAEAFEAAHSNRAHSRLLDVTDRDGVTAVVNEVVREIGPLDVIVNNAGVGIVGALEELTAEEIRLGLETNLFGPLNVIQAALPHLRARGFGHLISVSSMAGYLSAPGIAAYSASKFALEGIMEGLSTELQPFGIRVTLVEPGQFKTDSLRSAIIAKRVLKDYESTAGRARTSLADVRVLRGDPIEVARAVLAVADAANPPLRLPVGSQALAAAQAKAERWLAELSAWAYVSSPNNGKSSGAP